MGSGPRTPDSTRGSELTRSSRGGSGRARPRTAPAPARAPSRARSLALALVVALAVSLAWSASALAIRRVAVTFSCTAVTYTFEGFAKGKENTVSETVRGDGTVLAEEKFTFEGPDGTNTLPVSVPAGRHLVKAESHWRTDGAIGESGRHREMLDCAAPMPALAIDKLQMIAGSGHPFSVAPLTGAIGQVVEYEIIISNTGNVPLVISNFTDAKCDPGTLSGGQGETPLEPGFETIYVCDHVLTEGGAYKNQATVTATPPSGAPITKLSQELEVTVPRKEKLEVSKLQEIAGSNAGYTESPLTASVNQTVDYEIVVKNAGTVPFALSEFVDVNCDPGTISGGPASGALLMPSESTVYTCTRKLTKAEPTRTSRA